MPGPFPPSYGDDENLNAARRILSRRNLEKLREELPDGSPLAQITDHILWDDDLDDEEMWPR